MEWKGRGGGRDGRASPQKIDPRTATAIHAIQQDESETRTITACSLVGLSERVMPFHYQPVVFW
jgi:hypothetical protein